MALINNATTSRLKPNSEQVNFRCAVSRALTPDEEDMDTNSMNVEDIVGANTKRLTKPKSNHLEIYNKIHNLNIFFGMMVGLKIDKEWKYNNLTRFIEFLLIFGVGTVIYTNVIFISQPKKIFEVLSLFSIVIPVYLKFYLILETHVKVLAFFDFFDKLFTDIDDGDKAKVLKTHISGAFTSVKLYITIQTLALAVFMCYPIYAYVTRYEVIQIMPMEFPFVDQSTAWGFAGANFIMVILGVAAYFGSVGYDFFLARMIDLYCLLVKLLEQDIAEYIEMSKKNSGYSKRYRRAFFRNILLKFQDKDRFIQHVNDLYSDVIFKQFSIVYIGLTFTIYSIIRNQWYSGFGMLSFCLVQMYILCILGTAISVQNEKLCAAIYNIPWYDYSLSEQKEILLLLHSSQNAMELWIGPFAPLNVESAMEITKSIYSTSTVILNTTE